MQAPQVRGASSLLSTALWACAINDREGIITSDGSVANRPRLSNLNLSRGANFIPSIATAFRWKQGTVLFFPATCFNTKCAPNAILLSTPRALLFIYPKVELNKPNFNKDHAATNLDSSSLEVSASNVYGPMSSYESIELGLNSGSTQWSSRVTCVFDLRTRPFEMFNRFRVE